MEKPVLLGTGTFSMNCPKAINLRCLASLLAYAESTLVQRELQEIFSELENLKNSHRGHRDRRVINQ